MGTLIRELLESPLLSGVAALITIGGAIMASVRLLKAMRERYRAGKEKGGRADEILVLDDKPQPDPEAPRRIYIVVGLALFMVLVGEALFVVELLRGREFDMLTIETRVLLAAIASIPWVAGLLLSLLLQLDPIARDRVIVWADDIAISLVVLGLMAFIAVVVAIVLSDQGILIVMASPSDLPSHK